MDNILNESQEILAERGQVYGEASESFDRIAQYWNNWLRDKLEIKADDVAMMMVLFKIARQQGKHQRDNLTDAINYLTLYNKVRLALSRQSHMDSTVEDIKPATDQKFPWIIDRLPTVEDTIMDDPCVAVYAPRELDGSNWTCLEHTLVKQGQPWMPLDEAQDYTTTNPAPKPSTLTD